MPKQEESGFFQTKQGWVVAGLIIAGIVFAVGWVIKSNLGQSTAAQLANSQTFVCSETGKAFQVTLESGMKIPVHSPFSGKDTGYPAELCYWTADGQLKDKPDPVLLNARIGQPEPTFCKICGRLVVHRNPRPAPGSSPPPTEAEYKQRHGDGGRASDRGAEDHSSP